jgi:acetyltransferase-like isoleucine patch superfamily enzyme
MPVPDNVVIGERSWLWSTFAFLHFQGQRQPSVTIGSDSGVYVGSMFDLGPNGSVEIGDYCAVGGAVFAVDSRVVIGDYAFLSFDVVIADRFAAVPPSERAPRPEAAVDDVKPSIVVGENAWIGARATLLAGARIGKGAIVGAATVVDFEVPPYAIVAGCPARIVGWGARS